MKIYLMIHILNILIASKQKYIPPSQRGAKGPVGVASTEKKFLSEVDEPTKIEGSKCFHLFTYF